MDMQEMGGWAFILGVVIALLAGLAVSFGALGGAAGWVVVVLVVLGLIVGFMNITDKETTPFLVASIALLAGSGAGLEVLPFVGTWIGNILNYIAVFVAPAAVIVALKAVRAMGSK
ncbi:MAG: hypothetical protein HY393_03070 [Candidatus Diapherotrites archaeon]|nr:hypothetical protein [Candidatus Diapherotrites archaeon]